MDKNEETEREIKENYTRPGHPSAFGGISKVSDYYRKTDNVSPDKIRQILSGVESYNLHRESKQLSRNPTFVHHKREQIQVCFIDTKFTYTIERVDFIKVFFPTLFMFFFRLISQARHSFFPKFITAEIKFLVKSLKIR